MSFSSPLSLSLSLFVVVPLNDDGEDVGQSEVENTAGDGEAHGVEEDGRAAHDILTDVERVDLKEGKSFKSYY